MMLLGACSDQNLGDLQNYVSDVKARKGQVEPLPVFEPVEVYAYQPGDMKDPFTNWKTEVAPLANGQGSGGETGPDANRQREELEAFPLDTLRMMGALEMKGVRWGLVKASDGIVYRVRKGNYIGQNFGEITVIEPERIVLTEIVPNGLGGWERREAALTLNMEQFAE
jgi:type IV pilus assembly protein PilP